MKVIESVDHSSIPYVFSKNLDYIHNTDIIEVSIWAICKYGLMAYGAEWTRTIPYRKVDGHKTSTELNQKALTKRPEGSEAEGKKYPIDWLIIRTTRCRINPLNKTLNFRKILEGSLTVGIHSEHLGRTRRNYFENVNECSGGWDAFHILSIFSICLQVLPIL